MKVRFFAVMVIIAGMPGFCQALEEDDMKVTFDLTYTSKWLSKGVEAYGDKGGLFKTIDLKFPSMGLGVMVTHRNAIGSGYVDSQRFDYRPYMFGQLFSDKKYAMNYNLSAGYEHYPGLARYRSYTTWEWIFAFSWPKILTDKLVPSYIAHYEYAAGENYTKPSGADIPSGWVHRFLLNWAMDVDQLPNDLNFSSELAYVDGLGGLEHDWGYSTFGLSTVFDLAENMTLSPGIYHQVSIGDTVSHKKDITYAKVSFKYMF